MTWGAVAIGGATLVSGYMGSKAAKDAAGASGDGADAASQVQWDMYDQSRNDQMPWLATGNNALQKLAALNGVQYASMPSWQLNTEANFNPTLYLQENPDVANDAYFKDRAWEHYTKHGAQEGRLFSYMPGVLAAGGGSQSSTPDYSAFYNSPDYQFAFDEGNRAAKASLAARGLSNSGRALKELTRYGQGMASQQLNTYRNALAAMAGVGQSTASNLGQQSLQTGQIVGQNTQNAADARASGYLGRSSAWTNAINQGTGLAAYGYGNNWWSPDRSNSIINSTRPVGG